MSYPDAISLYTMRFEEQFWESETKVSVIVEKETSIFRTFDLETLVQIHLMHVSPSGKLCHVQDQDVTSHER